MRQKCLPFTWQISRVSRWNSHCHARVWMQTPSFAPTSKNESQPFESNVCLACHRRRRFGGGVFGGAPDQETDRSSLPAVGAGHRSHWIAIEYPDSASQSSHLSLRHFCISFVTALWR